MSATVTISILTHTALGAAKRCINSVFSFSDDYELILTANGNPKAAEYFHRLARNHKHVRVVVNPVNRGFIEPNRHALELTDTPLFVMLNDDTLVCPKWLDMLRAPFQQHPKAALSGPRARCSRLNPQMRGIPGYGVEYLEGSCLMGRTSLLKQYGLFSPNLLFAYGEDSDLSLRMRELGFTIHQVPFSLPFHAGGATTRTVPGLAPIIAANHEYLVRRWADYLKNPARKFPHEL